MGRFAAAVRWCVAMCLIVPLCVASPDEVDAITYGNQVDSPQRSYPEVVPIFVGEDGLCTGTLIEQQVVLTAAHCVYGEDSWQVSVGGADLYSGILIDVDAAWYHPRYDDVFAVNDVGLLHLAEPADVSKVASLPKSSTSAKPKSFRTLGWGRDQNGKLTGKLSVLKLDNYEAYAKKSYGLIYNTKTMIGAGRFFAAERLYGGACRGDSGGPLYSGVKGRVLVGVTSFGSAKGCTVYKPTVFVRLSYYVQTIRAGVKKLKARAANSPIPAPDYTWSTVPEETAVITTIPSYTTTSAPKSTTTIPATTTTVLPALTVGYTTSSQRSSWENPGIKGEFVANAEITKWCLTLDDQPLPDYRYVTGKDFEINFSDTPTQSGGAGCYEKLATYSSYSRQSSVYVRGPSGLDEGRHSIVMTAYDAAGRQASSPTVYFNGKISSTSSMFAGSISTRSRTEELEIKVSVTNSTTGYSADSYVTKVCHTIVRDGVAVTDVKSGLWAASDATCVSNPSTTIQSYDTSSAVVTDPEGKQRWGVYATVYNSKGQSFVTDAVWFDN